MRYVKPLKGLIVRIPESKLPLPPEGGNVDYSGQKGKYWRRRIKDGSVIVTSPPKAEKPKDDVKKKETHYGDKL